ncbi:Precorrin-6A synthase (Deacetylating) [metagenome]|uniref:Precorrin-6A synthase (Deacetylating) n=1 Tax=metagenome TaxID=256318 RepID=A0A2P2C843_9ZZZZ
MIIRLIGIGPGDPDQVTVQAVRALREVDYVVLTDKAAGATDPLVAARERLLAHHLDQPPRLVVVADPSRDRTASGTSTPEGYARAVGDWHEARAAAYEKVLREHGGAPGFLVWGDPGFYDSSIRVLERVAHRIGADLDVIPGISSIQLLAARHRIVLHDVGSAIHITTGRELSAALASGQRNVVVVLNRDLSALADPLLTDWQVWWGANLGTPHEALVAGRVGDVLACMEAARRTTKEHAGWVMDTYLLRHPR